MIRLELAQRLQAAGVQWSPARGDRFVVPDRDMDDDVFVVSDMAVEVREYATGQVLGFNGTTEWALDSLERDDVLWLPRESQLREILGWRFVRLERTDAGYAVVLRADGNGEDGTGADGAERAVTDADAESAYALAVLALLG